MFQVVASSIPARNNVFAGPTMKRMPSTHTAWSTQRPIPTVPIYNTQPMSQHSAVPTMTAMDQPYGYGAGFSQHNQIQMPITTANTLRPVATNKAHTTPLKSLKYDGTEKGDDWSDKSVLFDIQADITTFADCDTDKTVCGKNLYDASENKNLKIKLAILKNLVQRNKVAYGVTVDLEKLTFNIGGEILEMSPGPKQSIPVVSNYHVNAKLENQLDNYIFEQCDEKLPILIPRCLYNYQDQPSICLVNASDVYYTLKRNSVIAKAEVVSEIEPCVSMNQITEVNDGIQVELSTPLRQLLESSCLNLSEDEKQQLEFTTDQLSSEQAKDPDLQLILHWLQKDEEPPENKDISSSEDTLLDAESIRTDSVADLDELEDNPLIGYDETTGDIVVTEQIPKSDLPSKRPT
ncbi:unnamed protein product [Mytilus coruscus]|uniref:Uncharacterized protein n=1 Tax=Mytilus coruscus TaxID=42192 RepID=A0A6J8BY35_MYTCO|nr:unnamed protein product [Mytilus coruscus]